MSATTLAVTDAIRAYLFDVNVREPPLLTRLREETQRLPSGGMQISPEQGRFMAFLTELLGVRRYLEVGVFTGYSSLSVALAMPPEGRIVACDRSEEWTRVARRYWKEAGVSEKVELRLGFALDTLDQLLESGARGSLRLRVHRRRQGERARVLRARARSSCARAVSSRSTTRSGPVASPIPRKTSPRL